MTKFGSALRFILLWSACSQQAAFAPASFGVKRTQLGSTTVADADVSKRTGKPTGTSFLPEETIERCKSGSPIEKIKMEKDATSAFVDIYEYARKIREGEMTWEDVEKADLDTVSLFVFPVDEALFFFQLNLLCCHVCSD
jgi:hypothetical protein